ncbi:unnamed protein product [Rhizophagus irregularis]|nr:unnamed protein product [Rhizophagus irregularis]CAB5386937.1 unnamed protein product [Rhizophagus irregularis]
MDVKYDDQNTEHQLGDVIAESSTKNYKKNSIKLNAKAISYIPKGKKHTVMFAEMASRNLDVGSNYDTFSISSSNRQKNNVTKRNVFDSKAELTKKKQQRASPKEIQSVMTRYIPILKDNIWEITLYDILSTWAQFEILQHLEK